MKISNFLFPESRSVADDGRIIDETFQEALLTDRLGYDTIWLAEHHFDGICAYVDPVAFAAALAPATKQARIGFAVAQMALHHPIRFAEQMALIDHLSKGRLTVGLGRGTAYNIYDYQGFGIDHTEAQARFEEAEAIMLKAWQGGPFAHKGKFFDNAATPNMLVKYQQDMKGKFDRINAQGGALGGVLAIGLQHDKDSRGFIRVTPLFYVLYKTLRSSRLSFSAKVQARKVLTRALRVLVTP